jgi:hypothetical protein
MTNTALGGSTVSAMAASQNPPNRLYYGRSNGLVYRVDGANAGDPVPVNVTGQLPSGGFVSSIAADQGTPTAPCHFQTGASPSRRPTEGFADQARTQEILTARGTAPGAMAG